MNFKNCLVVLYLHVFTLSKGLLWYNLVGDINMLYKTEEEFLKAYNPRDFDPMSITTDILILSISDEEVSNYRKTSKKHMSVLLVKRDDFPYKDKWCLPGGFLRVDEELEDCPRRILATETNLHDIYLEQLYTYGGVKRDPRMRVVSTSYMALIDKNRLDYKISDNASWFNINYVEESGKVYVTLDNGNETLKFTIKKTLREKTTDRYKFDIIENNSIAFDHPLVIWAGIERLKNKISYTDVVFNMMPEYFALGDLQQVYEVILNKKLLDPAFRRIIADKVEKTDLVKTGAGHRPSALFRYKKR
jgi:ADP-ribose pyrophosphatase YjhB (NUDIX family)